MRCQILALLVLGAAADEDIILNALSTDTSLPERLLVLMPGGLVPNIHYKLTGEAIQKATTGVRLTVVIPEVFQRLCIITCPFTKTCSPLKSRVDDAVSKSTFKGKNPKEDTFLAGHSLGATCANYLAQAYSYEFAGLLEFGGYVDMTGAGSIPNYAIPVLHMAGELDGGGARPSTMAGLYAMHKAYAATAGEEKALQAKPVQVLEGMDHSDFCPGFFVTKTKDCKSEVTQDVAMATIGEVAAAFLHLNSPVSAATKAAALATMKTRSNFTKEMCEPYLTAFELEKGQLASPPAGVPAGPWCNLAQQQIVGLDTTDAPKLKIEPGMCKLITEGLHEFEHQHTNYTVTGDSMEITCYAAVEPAGSSIDSTQFAPASVDCKMVDATRVAEQLKLTPPTTTVQCGEINKKAVEVALKLLPAKSLKRFQEKGRGVCYMPDTEVFGNIGPLWVKSSLTKTETTKCLEVASSRLLSPITSPVFPGNHYCKLWSPSDAMDWMMTDSHKPFPYPKETATVETIQI